MKWLFCLPGNNFSGEFLDAWNRIISYCHTNGIQYYVSRAHSCLLSYSRNLCLGGNNLLGRKQHPFNDKINDFSNVIWLDSDNICTPEQIHILVNHNLDFCAGLYLMANGTQYAAVRDLDEDYFMKYGTFQFLTPDDIKGKRQLLEVSYCGFGCAVTSRKLLWDLEYPWFKTRFENMGGRLFDETMEDYDFCLTAQEKGYKIWVDTGIIVKHLKLKAL